MYFFCTREVIGSNVTLLNVSEGIHSNLVVGRIYWITVQIVLINISTHSLLLILFIIYPTSFIY